MIYRWPAIPASGVPTTTHQLVAHGLIALGLWLGLEHTSLTPDQRRATWLAIFIPDTLWFAVAWYAAINGAFRTDASPLPVLPLAIFLPVIIGAPLLLLSKRVGQVLDAMPASWLVAAITLGLITSPGRFQLIVPDVSSIGAGAYPGVLTPAFVVPSSILLHALSLRQLRRRSKAEAARR